MKNRKTTIIKNIYYIADLINYYHENNNDISKTNFLSKKHKVGSKAHDLFFQCGFHEKPKNYIPTFEETTEYLSLAKKRQEVIKERNQDKKLVENNEPTLFDENETTTNVSTTQTFSWANECRNMRTLCVIDGKDVIIKTQLPQDVQELNEENLKYILSNCLI